MRFLSLVLAAQAVVPLTAQETIADSSAFNNTDNTDWPYMIILASSSDGASSQEQKLAINITSLPNGAQYRVVKSTEGGTGNYYNSPPKALSLGYNLIVINVVSFDRNVRIQFSSGDIEYNGLFINPNFGTRTIGVDDFFGLNTGDVNNLAIDVSSNGFNLKLGPGTSSLERDAYGVGTSTFGMSGDFFDGSYAKFGNTYNQQQLDLRITNNTGSDVKLKRIAFDLRRDPANHNYATDFQILYLNSGDSALINGPSVALGSELGLGSPDPIPIGSGTITTGINNVNEYIGENISGTAWIANDGYANIRLKLNATAPAAATQLDNLVFFLEVIDLTAPVITLTGLSTLTLTQGDNFTDPGATVTDNSGESIHLVVSGDTVDTSVPGTYTIYYTAQDSAGNTSSSTRTVTVVCGDDCALLAYLDQRGLTPEDLSNDTDNNGMTVLEEYLAGSDPDAAMPRYGMDAANGSLTLTSDLQYEPGGITVNLEASTDLITFTSVYFTMEAPTSPNDDGSYTRSYKEQSPPTADKRFLRLSIQPLTPSMQSEEASSSKSTDASGDTT